MELSGERVLCERCKRLFLRDYQRAPGQYYLLPSWTVLPTCVCIISRFFTPGVIFAGLVKMPARHINVYLMTSAG